MARCCAMPVPVSLDSTSIDYAGEAWPISAALGSAVDCDVTTAHPGSSAGYFCLGKKTSHDANGEIEQGPLPENGFI
jgi:hypothetical protein